MFRNDSMPVAGSPETSNTNKCANVIKTVLRKRREKSLPSMRKIQDFDSLNSLKNENGSNAIQIKSGLALKRVYNIEKAEVVNPDFMKKVKTELKSKTVDKKRHSQSDKAQNREQIKKSPKRKEHTNPQIKKQVKPGNLRQKIQEKREEKLRKEEQQRIEEKQEKQRIEEKHRIEEKQRSEEKRRSEEKQRNEDIQKRRSEDSPFEESQCSQENMKSFSYKRKNLEKRLAAKIWQILSRDVFLLDHEKFNDQIQATNSETKNYIISVIKKSNNNKKLKRLNPRKVTQTTKESRYHAGKRAIKCAVRRRVWKLAKTSMKHSKHWSQFLAENNIILENINIDKFDLSLIDLDALGIESKILKRTVTWLFK